ncbi:MAG: hydroxymethylbilane synthase [Bacteroidetes bacterium]|nr:hydroxymethylbilane synthase [Bacteroidota bacterium]
MQIKIGTRNSPLALWQAREVARILQNKNYLTDITPIVSSGDKNLNQPLYAMGITGVFTRDLDIALLEKEVHIAVHSLKDVPTEIPENLELIAYLKRDFPQDVLVRSTKSIDKPLHELKIATSSLRRRAFWSREFPNTEFVDIRGNVNTRLQKIEDGLADATLFSLAGIKRLDLKIKYEELPFMISAPSQGVVVVAGNSSNVEINEILKKINDPDTQKCVEIERNFLKTLEGGCTAPIGGLATINNEKIHFIGRLCSLDGTECIEINETMEMSEKNIGEKLAHQVLDKGGKELMKKIKSQIEQ